MERTVPNSELQRLRKEYSDLGLKEDDVPKRPLDLFRLWFDQAVLSQLVEPNAMAVATVGEDGTPSARMVLLKQCDATGFIFFSNYNSRKGREICKLPQVALLFYWAELERQVRVEGVAQRITRAESEEYFAIRPRGAQLSAAVSPQSQIVPNRTHLEHERQELDQRLQGTTIPCPESWGGYRVTPRRFEFWQGRENRLHDRLEFLPDNSGWMVRRLAP